MPIYTACVWASRVYEGRAGTAGGGGGVGGIYPLKMLVDGAPFWLMVHFFIRTRL